MIVPRIQIVSDIKYKNGNLKKIWRFGKPLILWQPNLFWHYFSYNWKLPKGELTRRACVEKRPLKILECIQDNIQL